MDSQPVPLTPARLRRGVHVPVGHVDLTRLVEDIALVADAGAAVVRIGLDWSWMQPSAGRVNGDAVEAYLAAAHAATGLGVELQFTLLEKATPRWFDNEGGFGDTKFALHWWPRWVQLCAESFGDHIGGWVPIEHPLGIANGLAGDDPRRHGDVVDTLVTAWRDAWRILRGGPPVITSFGLEVVRPADQTIQAAEAAHRLDQLRWGIWLQGLADGTISIPGRAEREVADLDGSCDVLGVIIRHERDTLGLLHRAAEQGPERPLAVTLMVAPGADAGRETAIERYLAAATEAAAEMPLDTVAVGPTFDLPGDERGIITRDRDLKDSARLLLTPAT